MRIIDSAPHVIDVLGIGNSLIASGFDSEAIERAFGKAGYPAVAINGGLGASGPIEHLLLTRRALRQHAVKQLVYGFFDQQMSEKPSLTNSDLIGNRAMLYDEEPRLVARYANFNWDDLAAFEAYRCCALLRERGTIWAKVEKMRRAMEEVGMPRQETNQFGRRADFNLLEFYTAEEFVRRCGEVMRTGEFLSAPLEELFREAVARGVKVIVVEMPMHPAHLAKFYDQPIWEQFRHENQRALARFGASYIDASHWVPEAGEFQDRLHLGPSGAAQFSGMLAERLLAPSPAPLTGH